MAHVLTAGELTTQRKPGQWGKYYLAVPEYHVVYSAVLGTPPTDNDGVISVDFVDGAGNIADVLPDMTMYVGTTLGGYELGMVRIRKAPIEDCENWTFYIGQTSNIEWDLPGTIYLTVVDDYQLWDKPIAVVSGEKYMDYDVDYSDQHADFDPVVIMGTHRVAKLTGASVNVTLGGADDTDDWVIDSTIASRQWTVAGATLDDATAKNPVATFNAAGTYLTYCEATGANGKTFTGVRYVIIWDDDNPLIQAFVLNNGEYSREKGSFQVTLFSNTTTADIRERSLVILCSEDYAENGAVTMPHQIAGANNIFACGYISDIQSVFDSDKGDITFTVESLQFWLAQARDYIYTIFQKAGTVATWDEMASLTVQKAVWHFLHWHSTMMRIADVIITDDTRLNDKYETTRGSLWEKIGLIAERIFAYPIVDMYGRLFVEIEPQMEAVADRNFPVVMTIQKADIEGEISWTKRDVKALSMLFWSSIGVDETNSASTFFSLSEGHTYNQQGEEEAYDNILADNQAKSNSLCGCYFGWRNGTPYDLNIDFVHSMRIVGVAPRQYYEFEIYNVEEPRGVGINKNLIPRAVRFSIGETGFMKISVAFEPESTPGIAVNGDIPTLESFDFSTPDSWDFGEFPEMPIQSVIETAPTEETDIQPKKVVVATNYGVFYTENFDEDNGADVVWKSMNVGLDADDKAEIQELIVTPSGKLYLMTNGDNTNGFDRLYSASGIGGAWSLLLSNTMIDTNYGFAGWKIWGIGANPFASDTFAAWLCRPWSFPFDGNIGYGRLGVITGGVISYGAGNDFARNGRAAVVFTNGGWTVYENQGVGILGSIVTSYASRLPANGGSCTAVNIEGSANFGSPHFACTAGSQDISYMWKGDGIYGAVKKVTSNGTVGSDLTFSPPPSHAISFSPTGTHAMGATAAGPFAAYKTTDGGANWVSVGGVIPIGSDVWENCGDNYRWIFGGGINMKLTMDQGATMLEKIGNLQQVFGLVDISIIRCIE